MLEGPERRWELESLTPVVREDLIRAAEQVQDALVGPVKFLLHGRVVMQHPMESVTLLVAVGMVRCGLKLIYPIQFAQLLNQSIFKSSPLVRVCLCWNTIAIKSLFHRYLSQMEAHFSWIITV